MHRLFFPFLTVLYPSIYKTPLLGITNPDPRRSVREPLPTVVSICIPTISVDLSIYIHPCTAMSQCGYARCIYAMHPTAVKLGCPPDCTCSALEEVLRYSRTFEHLAVCSCSFAVRSGLIPFIPLIKKEERWDVF